MSEATALPTVPQPLPMQTLNTYFLQNTHRETTYYLTTVAKKNILKRNQNLFFCSASAERTIFSSVRGCCDWNVRLSSDLNPGSRVHWRERKIGDSKRHLWKKFSQNPSFFLRRGCHDERETLCRKLLQCWELSSRKVWVSRYVFVGKLVPGKKI